MCEPCAQKAATLVPTLTAKGFSALPGRKRRRLCANRSRSRCWCALGRQSRSNVQRSVVPGASHIMHEDNPPAVNEAVLGFLR